MDTAYEEFFSQFIPVFFFFFFLFLYRGFTYHRQNACLSEADLVIPGPDLSGQHVHVRYYVLDSYYYSGHWGYIYINKGINQALCVGMQYTALRV